eukprot:944133-Pyramimonas_sp.AAC.1
MSRLIPFRHLRSFPLPLYFSSEGGGWRWEEGRRGPTGCLRRGKEGREGNGRDNWESDDSERQTEMRRGARGDGGGRWKWEECQIGG